MAFVETFEQSTSDPIQQSRAETLRAAPADCGAVPCRALLPASPRGPAAGRQQAGFLFVVHSSIDTQLLVPAGRSATHDADGDVLAHGRTQPPGRPCACKRGARTSYIAAAACCPALQLQATVRSRWQAGLDWPTHVLLALLALPVPDARTVLFSRALM